jgi:hypothetical protein
MNMSTGSAFALASSAFVSSIVSAKKWPFLDTPLTTNILRIAVHGGGILLEDLQCVLPFH